MLYQQSYHGAHALSQYKFLVTGGAGFIGSNLVEYLLKYGAGHVTVLDNLSNGYEENLQAFASLPNFTFVKGDMLDFALCQELCNGTDYVLHQAALGSVPRSIANPIATNDANVTGFLNVLTAAKNAGVKRFIYASSSSVYGDHPDLPKREELTGNCLSPYAVSKMVNELYAQVFHRTYHLPTVGLRYFNVFGPKQSPNGPYAAVIPLFAESMIKGESPYINGDGQQTRDFTFIENVVQANVKALFAPESQVAGKVYNAGAHGRISLTELVDTLNEVLGTKIKPIFREPRAGDIRDSFANVSKAKADFGYEPAFSFLDGLKMSIDWYRKLVLAAN